MPPLLVLDAEVELASAVGLRRMALRDFIAGYRKTLLQPGEFLAAVIVPTVPAGNSAFVKLGARKYLVISIVMVAAVVEKDRGGAVVSARIAVGSASEKALRLHDLERELAGCAAGKAPSALLRPEHFDCLSPIGDVRATAAYRLEAARQLVGEALDRASGFET